MTASRPAFNGSYPRNRPQLHRNRRRPAGDDRRRQDISRITATRRCRWEMEAGPGDILLLLDACWNSCDDYPPLMRRFKAQGGKTVVVVYDILPLDYPRSFQPITTACFRAWREEIVGRADAAVAISRATAESLYTRICEMPARARRSAGGRSAPISAAAKGEPSATAVVDSGGSGLFPRASARWSRARPTPSPSRLSSDCGRRAATYAM